MLKRLFTSNTRIKLLRVFVRNPKEEYFIRELTRKLDEQINSIRRELDNLKKFGFLRSRTKLRKKYYFINKNFILFEELKSIILKAESAIKSIAKDVAKMGEVKLLALTGQFVEKPSESVDLLLVGNVNKEKFAKYLNTELRTKRPVKFTIMTEDDFKYRLNCNDKFIKDIISDENNQLLIDKIQHLTLI